MAQLRATSLALDARLQPFGIRSEHLLPMFSDKRDWNPKARVLTDQYSPANLLNLGGE
jgi:spermidine synthase